MAGNVTVGSSRLWSVVRWLVWGGAAFLLLLPLVAMQFTEEVSWTMYDFVIMGTMLGMVCASFELVVRVARSDVYVVAAGIAVATAFLMTWANLAVGIIGDETHPANGIFYGVLAIGFIAVTLSRMEPRGMARAMEVTAIAQAIASVIAFILGERYVFVLTCIFAAMWVISALLFRKAAQTQRMAGAAT